MSVIDEPFEENVKVGAYFILSELMTNAAKHAPGSAIAVRAAVKGAELVLEVTDTGPGGANPLGSGLRGGGRAGIGPFRLVHHQQSTE